MLQVLKLEFSLEEEEGRNVELQQALRERDAARSAAAAVGPTAGAPGSLGPPAVGQAAGGTADTSAAGLAPAGLLPAINTSPPVLNNLGIFDAGSDDGWASTPTVDSLLPKIVALWDELYVPLVYRSRFYLSFRGREVFYYEVEARRLEWKRSQMLAGAADEPAGWGEQTNTNQSHLGRGSFGGESTTPSTPPHGARGPAGGSTPRPRTSASAAAALTASSSFSGVRRRSKELDKAARWEPPAVTGQGLLEATGLAAVKTAECMKRVSSGRI